MKCPVCNRGLAQKKYYQIFIWTCNECGGIWFEEGMLKEYIQYRLLENQDIPTQDFPMEKKTVIGEKEIQDTMKKCPKCGQGMKSFNYCYDSNIILDRCTVCNGIWTDKGEVDKVMQYHNVNPHLDEIGRGLADQASYRSKLEEIKNNWRDGYKR